MLKIKINFFAIINDKAIIDCKCVVFYAGLEDKYSFLVKAPTGNLLITF